MIRALILDGEHEGTLMNLPVPQPFIRMVNKFELSFVPLVEATLSDRTTPHYIEYKMVFKPVDNGDIYLYAERPSQEIFLRQQRDWVVKDKYERYNYRRKPILFEDNNPYAKELQKRVEAIKAIIKANVVPKQDFDLEGHLWYLTHASKA